MFIAAPIKLKNLVNHCCGLKRRYVQTVNKSSRKVEIGLPAIICCQLSNSICACLATGVCVGSVTLELRVMKGTCSWSALLLQISERERERERISLVHSASIGL